jgi:ABC-type Mn2+/Zn2+ transport system ATPase subunit
MSQQQVCILKIYNTLLNVLNKLVDRGNTVLVIEHNLDVIKVADHVIDLGPRVVMAAAEFCLKEHLKNSLKTKKAILPGF